MHELSVVQSLMDIVLAEAQKHGATRVSQINVEVGELRGIVPDSMHFYFDMIKRDTIAQEAQLNICVVPARRRCRACGGMVEHEAEDSTCPLCQGTDLEYVMGLELLIKDIEVD